MSTRPEAWLRPAAWLLTRSGLTSIWPSLLGRAHPHGLTSWRAEALAGGVDHFAMSEL